MKHKEPNKKTVNLLLGLLVIGVAMFLFGLSKIGVDIISLIVSLTSFALAILALYLSKRSDDKMKAMARSAFREKMAMMYFYMEREQERRESDVEAVKELEEWVGDDLKRKYKKLKAEYDKVTGSKIKPARLAKSGNEGQVLHPTNCSGEITVCEGIISPKEDDIQKQV